MKVKRILATFFFWLFAITYYKNSVAFIFYVLKLENLDFF
jgi:hypothetical protein